MLKRVKKFGIIAGIALTCLFLARCMFFSWESQRPPKGSILALEIKGLIGDKSDFLMDLRKYARYDEILGVLVRVDSPGGYVSTSQELYSEFRYIKETLKKPVVVSAGNMLASGALYVASGASKILVNRGTLVGSIGVVIKFYNLERLYDLIKVSPYSIKTGEFKDIGSMHRAMSARERDLLQDLLDETLDQFKSAVIEGREIEAENLDPYLDARVFSGESAVNTGFADSIGTLTDAISQIGKLTGLGEDPILFTPKEPVWDRLLGPIEDGRRGGGTLGKANASSSLTNGLNHRGWGFRFLSILFSLFGQDKNALHTLGESAILTPLYFPEAQPLYVFPPAIGM